MLFLKWSTDITIQSRAFSVHTTISQLYILQHKQKAPIHMLSRSKANLDIREKKTVDFFSSTARASTLGPAITLLTIFAKVSVPVKAIIPWFQSLQFKKLPFHRVLKDDTNWKQSKFSVNWHLLQLLQWVRNKTVSCENYTYTAAFLF